MKSAGRERLTKEERSWIIYDVANSAFILIVVTTIMPIFFATVAAVNLEANRATALWGYTNTIASILVAVLAPILGSFADQKGMKKRLFLVFLGAGVVMTFLFPTIREGMVSYTMIISIVAFVGYSGANLFYDSFLTDVTTNDRMDSVSTKGFAWGYIGSVVPFLIAFLFILNPDFVGGPLMATRIAFFITAFWWLGFSLPIIRNVHQLHFVAPNPHPVRSAFLRLGRTFSEIRKYRTAFIFLLAYFFYIDGVDTIIKMATIYGTEIGLDETQLIMAVLGIQIVAFPFALLYGRLSKRYGVRQMLFTGIGVYIVIVILGFFLPVFGDRGLQRNVFWFMAFLVATSQGGIQALSRSYFGKLIPKEQSGEFFGFYNIFGKFAAIVGPFLLAITADLTGESRFGVLSLTVLFAAGGVLLIAVGRTERREAATNRG